MILQEVTKIESLRVSRQRLTNQVREKALRALLGDTYQTDLIKAGNTKNLCRKQHLPDEKVELLATVAGTDIDD